jgi:hypothetical protein
VAVDLDREAVELRGDAACGVLEGAADEDGDRGCAFPGELVGLDLAQDGDPEAVLLDGGRCGNYRTAKQER